MTSAGDTEVTLLLSINVVSGFPLSVVLWSEVKTLIIIIEFLATSNMGDTYKHLTTALGARWSEEQQENGGIRRAKCAVIMCNVAHAKEHDSIFELSLK